MRPLVLVGSAVSTLIAVLPVISQAGAPLTFNRTVSVPAGTDTAVNGQNLQQVLSTIASGSTRYKVVLDAGTYYVPGTLTVPPNVALQGAGRRITTIFIDAGARNPNGYFSVEGDTGVDEISSLTVTGNGYATFSGNNIVVFNVTLSTFSTQFTGTPGSRLAVSDSQIVIGGNPQFNSLYLTGNGGLAVFHGVEMPVPAIFAGGKYLCLDSYTGAGVVLSQGCS